MQINKFNKKPGSKTGFIIDDSCKESIFFTPTVYVVKPRYINSKSPAFSLVNGKGQHVSGLFPSGIDKIYLGDFQNRGLMVMLREEEKIEVFLSEMPPVLLKSKLLSGELNSQIQKTRISVAA